MSRPATAVMYQEETTTTRTNMKLAVYFVIAVLLLYSAASALLGLLGIAEDAPTAYAFSAVTLAVAVVVFSLWFSRR